MRSKLKSLKEQLTGVFGPPSEKKESPLQATSHFHSDQYLRYNQRVQEHLATLDLDLNGTSVLEVGAGIGDHTSFFLDRHCRVMTTDARRSNLEIIKKRYPQLRMRHLDLESPDRDFLEVFDVVYCYGVLYHLSDPTEAIAFLSKRSTKLMLIQTCVSPGNDDALNPVSEPKDDPSQSVSGHGCRPTRKWFLNRLKQHFPFVYIPRTQPSHEEFPTDWNVVSTHRLSRSIFIASHQNIESALLSEDLLIRQKAR
jgi:SAM-dependent methyltransferase